MPDHDTPNSIDQAGGLLARAALGDEPAFAALYDLVVPRIHGLVLRVLRDHAMSEEVTQEVMLEVWRNAHRFDADRGTPLSWLLTIAHRRAVDRVRYEERYRDRDTRVLAGEQEVAWDSTVEAAEAGAEAADAVSRVRAALEELTAIQRSAVELAYFGGLTHTEVAARLGLPLGTAKTRIRDGLLRLRDRLDAPLVVV